MVTPPPVSVDAYPREVGSEVRSNYLRVGMTVSGGYIDNLYAGSADTVVGEQFYSIRPTIAFDATSYRQQSTLLYSPGFTFYEPTNDLSYIDQSLIFNYRFLPTPHGLLRLNDIFLQGTSSFNPVSSGGGGISGSSSASSTGIIAPFSKQLTNRVNAEYSLQYSTTSMFGINGSLYDLHFPDPAQVPGLYDSNERGGGGFYNKRITSTQYIGVNYRYARILAHPEDGRSEMQTHSPYLFYTVYPTHGFSVSVTGGPQKYDSETSIPHASSATGVDASSSSGWAPGVTASTAWQTDHLNVAASYSRSIVSGGGVVGTFNSNSAGMSVRWQPLRTWIFDARASYDILKSVAPVPFLSTTEGGHSIAGTVTADHSFNAHFGMTFEYDRLHQSYAGIPAASINPDSDRGMISVYWQFARPLGR